VDKAVKELLSDAENQATDIITKHRTLLDNLIHELERHETLDLEQIQVCLGNKVSQLKTTTTKTSKY
jgi:cell division protease FtsH